MAGNIHDTHEDAFVNSIIGDGTILKGEFELNGLLRIDGTFYGKVKTNGKVLVGKNGIAECDIFAGTIVIGGKVKGEVIATERIILLSTGELIGNIKTPRLIIEEGVIFEGTCEIIEDKDRLQKIKEQNFEKTDPFKREPTEKGSEAMVSQSLSRMATTTEKTKIT
jgi:cytoskeletal protein CcmA (bactofilin family)